MKHLRNLTLRQKKELKNKGYEVDCYKVVKNTSEFTEYFNVESGVCFKIWR